MTFYKYDSNIKITTNHFEEPCEQKIKSDLLLISQFFSNAQNYFHSQEHNKTLIIMKELSEKIRYNEIAMTDSLAPSFINGIFSFLETLFDVIDDNELSLFLYILENFIITQQHFQSMFVDSFIYRRIIKTLNDFPVFNENCPIYIHQMINLLVFLVGQSKEFNRLFTDSNILDIIYEKGSMEDQIAYCKNYFKFYDQNDISSSFLALSILSSDMNDSFFISRIEGIQLAITNNSPLLGHLIQTGFLSNIIEIMTKDNTIDELKIKGFLNIIIGSSNTYEEILYEIIYNNSPSFINQLIHYFTIGDEYIQNQVMIIISNIISGQPAFIISPQYLIQESFLSQLQSLLQIGNTNTKENCIKFLMNIISFLPIEKVIQILSPPIVQSFIFFLTSETRNQNILHYLTIIRDIFEKITLHNDHFADFLYDNFRDNDFEEFINEQENSYNGTISLQAKNINLLFSHHYSHNK